MRRQRYVVSGMVQGVGFRWFVLREANRLALRGWVTNLPDGSVEVVAEGTEDRLGELEAALTRGPSVARVRDVAKFDVPRDVDVSNFFDIR
jgi:acylphosphatase